MTECHGVFPCYFSIVTCHAPVTNMSRTETGGGAAPARPAHHHRPQNGCPAWSVSTTQSSTDSARPQRAPQSVFSSSQLSSAVRLAPATTQHSFEILLKGFVVNFCLEWFITRFQIQELPLVKQTSWKWKVQYYSSSWVGEMIEKCINSGIRLLWILLAFHNNGGRSWKLLAHLYFVLSKGMPCFPIQR